MHHDKHKQTDYGVGEGGSLGRSSYVLQVFLLKSLFLYKLDLTHGHYIQESRATMSKTVLVTVGTTKFDELIHAVIQPDALTALKQQGYTDVLLQTGNTDVEIAEAGGQLVLPLLQVPQPVRASGRTA